MLLTQVFQFVLGEVDDEQPALRSQHARRLGDHPGRVLGIVQHLMDGHRVEGPALDRKLVHVAVAHEAVA